MSGCFFLKHGVYTLAPMTSVRHLLSDTLSFTNFTEGNVRYRRFVYTLT